MPIAALFSLHLSMHDESARRTSDVVEREAGHESTDTRRGGNLQGLGVVRFDHTQRRNLVRERPATSPKVDLVIVVYRSKASKEAVSMAGYYDVSKLSR